MSIRLLLMDYASRRLSATETTTVASHLETCETCRRLLAEEQSIGRALSAVPMSAPRCDLWAMTEQRRRAASSPRKSWLANVRSAFAVGPSARLALAPAFAAVLAVALLLSPQRGPNTASQTAEAVAAIRQVRETSVQSDDPLKEFSDRTWETLAVQGRS